MATSKSIREGIISSAEARRHLLEMGRLHSIFLVSPQKTAARTVAAVNGRVLRPIHPNAGIRASYRRKLDSLIRDMQDSYVYWLRAQFRETPPRMAQDATPAMRDIIDATVTANVSLIKSIASEYHTEVEGLVMRSVTAGRDLSFLTDELEKRYGITRRRAANIALSQNNLATSALRRARTASSKRPRRR